MFVGIDLGTLKSVVATHQDGRQDIMVNGLGQRHTPNVIAFSSNLRLFGDQAAVQLKLNMNNTFQYFTAQETEVFTESRSVFQDPVLRIEDYRNKSISLTNS